MHRHDGGPCYRPDPGELSEPERTSVHARKENLLARAINVLIFTLILVGVAFARLFEALHPARRTDAPYEYEDYSDYL